MSKIGIALISVGPILLTAALYRLPDRSNVEFAMAIVPPVLLMAGVTRLAAWTYLMFRSRTYRVALVAVFALCLSAGIWATATWGGFLAPAYIGGALVGMGMGLAVSDRIG